MVREKIYGAIFEGDLRLAASRAGVTLKLYTADVDKEGMDILLVDENRHRPIQTKAVAPSAKTKTWGSFKTFLRPGRRTASRFDFSGFPPTHEGTGLEGGIVLIRINNLESANVEYWYTDFFIIYAFSERFITERGTPSRTRGRKPKSRHLMATAVLAELERGLPSTTGVLPRISIPSQLFVKARSSDHLLALMNLQNKHTQSWSWPWNFCIAIDNQFEVDQHGHVSARTLPQIVRVGDDAADELLNLIDNPELKKFES